jgi:uncharacterized membrane protein HdeD (DUF308 family)
MKILKLTTAAMLLFAIFPLPYGYYQLLRIAVTISSGISAFRAYEKKNQILAIVFGLVFILFNPIIPIYLDKGSWVFIDIIVGIFFGVNGYSENE